MCSTLNAWLGASSVFVGGDEEFTFAESADVHFIILANSQVMGPVRSLSFLVGYPCGFCEDSLRVGLSNFAWVLKLESSAVENEDSLDALLLADILDVTEGFSVKIQVVLRVVILLKMLGYFAKVGQQIIRISFDNVLDQEFNELLFRRRNVWQGLHC